MIGLAQLVAVLPGVSRSGATIAAALACRLDRPSAARFSFLLSIPAVLGATLLEAKHAWSDDVATALPLDAALVGLVTSTIVGFITLHGLIRLLARVGVWPFVPYLLLMGAITQFVTR